MPDLSFRISIEELEDGIHLIGYRHGLAIEERGPLGMEEVRGELADAEDGDDALPGTIWQILIVAPAELSYEGWRAWLNRLLSPRNED